MMKHFFLFVVIFSFGFAAQAQLKPRTINKKAGSYSYTYHKNGKLSTEIFRPKDATKGGHAIAYNNKGVRIYKKETSRQHMISSVNFTYHENGAVKSAENSWHPDGGIQWGKETTWFDETGKVVNTITENHDDNNGLTPGEYIQEEPVIKIEKKDTVKFNPCDSIQTLDYGPYSDTVVENMFTKWHRTEFNRICTKNKVKKITCSGCSLVIADLELEIDGTGKVTAIRFISGTACGQDMPEAFAKDITESIAKLIFPKQCYNGCFDKRVGRSLKC